MSLPRIHCVASVMRIDRGETTAMFPWKLRLDSSRGAFDCTVIYDQLPDGLTTGSRIILDGVLVHLGDASTLVHATQMSLFAAGPILDSVPQEFDALDAPTTLRDQLEILTADLATLPLRTFLSNCFALPLVSVSFFDAPASQANHHAFPGGLAAHSIEVGALFKHIAESAPALPPEQIEIGVVAALLHDIGKLVPREQQPCELPYYMRHEVAGLKLLAPVIDTLADTRPDLAYAIRYCLHEHRLRRSESGRLIHCLQHADRYSAASCNEFVAQQCGRRDGDHVTLDSNGPLRTYFLPRLGQPDELEVFW